jgi:hypothetical protein
MRPTKLAVKVAAKQTRLGEVEAADEREAIEKAAKEFRPHASKLIAVRRGLATVGARVSGLAVDRGPRG